MILMKLRDYLKEKHTASLSDVARHFDIPESAVQNMLEHWVQKGQVTVGYATVDAGASCSSGCGGCSVGKSVEKNKTHCGASSMVYHWRNSS
ncbi:MAG: FeoC-like transcriptional regulator [Proteobacteria bacterium]|nr:FeoC-like transcriptional regulator [Pseudomonadota bacterium]MCL2307303.1 FeoC-like transcriptional regulator [Pseudomonadota bacterium]